MAPKTKPNFVGQGPDPHSCVGQGPDPLPWGAHGRRRGKVPGSQEEAKECSGRSEKCSKRSKGRAWESLGLPGVLWSVEAVGVRVGLGWGWGKPWNLPDRNARTKKKTTPQNAPKACFFICRCPRREWPLAGNVTVAGTAEPTCEISLPFLSYHLRIYSI